MTHKNEMASIVIHGFNNSSKDVEVLSQYLNSRGIYTITPTLAGTSGSKKEWNTTTWKDWISNAEKDFIKLKEQFKKVAAVGFSMGGLVAIHLANKFGVDLLTTVNTPIYCGDRKKIFENIRTGIRERSYEPIKNYYNVINETPMRAVLYLSRGLKECVPLVEKIKVPTLVIQGLKDEAVRWKSADYLFCHCDSPRKKKIYYRNADHFIFNGNEKEDVCKEIFHYLVQTQV